MSFHLFYTRAFSISAMAASSWRRISAAARQASSPVWMILRESCGSGHAVLVTLAEMARP
jgi:hypothetical protein